MYMWENYPAWRPEDQQFHEKPLIYPLMKGGKWRNRFEASFSREWVAGHASERKWRREDAKSDLN